jgi:tripartite ATP-independent transporter DctP family solute receptor
MKKAITGSFALLVSMSMIFAGCGGGGGSNTKTTAQPAPPQPQQAAPAADQKATVFKLAHVNPKDSPVGQGAHKFAELVDKGTNGKVKIEVYDNGTLGGEKQTLDSMKFGAVEMTIVGDIVFSTFAPEYGGLATPYLFRDNNHLRKVLEGDIGKEIDDKISKNAGSTVLSWWDRSPRNLTARKEIKTPEALAGMKLRTPEIANILDSWKALGANPTPMAFTELFTALEQKVVDGQENPVDLVYTNKFNEVQSHIMKTEHLIAPFVLMVNSKKLEALPADAQKVIKDAAKEAEKYEADLTKKSEDDYFKKLQDAGMKVVEVDKALFAKKLEAAKVEEKYADKWAPDLLKRIRDVK